MYESIKHFFNFFLVDINVTFSNSLRTRTSMSILFYSQGQTVFTCSDGRLTTDERYDGRASIVEPPEFSDTISTTINVSSLRESDTGDYECHVIYSGGDLQSTLLPSSLPPLLSSQLSTVSTLTSVSEDIGDGHNSSDGHYIGARFRLVVQGVLS